MKTKISLFVVVVLCILSISCCSTCPNYDVYKLDKRVSEQASEIDSLKTTCKCIEMFVGMQGKVIMTMDSVLAELSWKVHKMETTSQITTYNQ